MTLSIISLVFNAILGGSLLTAILRHRIQSRGEERVDFSTVLAEVKAQRDDAWAKIEKQSERINQMEVEIQGLRLARDLDPFPNWIVDLQGRYVFVNREFEKLVLEPRGQSYRDIIGKRHEDLWQGDFCRTLKALDAAAKSRPDGTARAVTRVSIIGLGETRVTIHKFPVRLKPSGVIMGYNGYFTDISFEDEILGDPSGAA